VWSLDKHTPSRAGLVTIWAARLDYIFRLTVSIAG
jgi:hypothetical protein